MEQKNIELLLKDLCARLPYGVKANIRYYDLQCDEGMCEIKYRDIDITYFNIEQVVNNWSECKPYLRPMESMTEEELFNYKHLDLLDYSNDGFEMPNYRNIDWLNAHHFDYRGLIKKGLALEAPKDMYK